eukprot:1504214-Rhodomonas_salina.1
MSGTALGYGRGATSEMDAEAMARETRTEVSSDWKPSGSSPERAQTPQPESSNEGGVMETRNHIRARSSGTSNQTFRQLNSTIR